VIVWGAGDESKGVDNLFCGWVVELEPGTRRTTLPLDEVVWAAVVGSTAVELWAAGTFSLIFP
jgi:hypothetical protein